MEPKSLRHFSRRRALQGIGGAALLGTTMQFGCGGNGSESSQGTSTPASVDTRPTPIPGVSAKKGGTLKVNMAGDPTGLDPSTSRGGGDHHWLYSIFDNLVNNDETFQVAKGIAESWEIVDELTVAFKIPNRSFGYHDGTPFDLSDIQYTIERHLDPDTKSFAAGSLGSVDRVELPDESTAVIKLKSVTASIFTILGDRAGMIMSPTPTKAAGEGFTNKPVGSGPYKLDSWEADASVKLSRFQDYRIADYPHMDGIDLQVVPNSSVRFANLRSGHADLILVDPKDVQAAQTDPAIQFVQYPSTAYNRVNMNISQWPLNDVRVRQALTYSVNRQAILDGVFFGVGVLANGPMTKASWAYNENLLPIEEDLTKAKQLLEAAGYGNGLEFDMLITANETDTPLASMLQSQWARAGIKVNLVSRSSEQAGVEYREQKFPMFLVGFSGRADPDLTIFDNYHSKGAFNRASFNTDYVLEESQVSLDEKILKARQIYDQDERKVLYDDIQKQIVENAHEIIMTHRSNLVGMSKRVRGFVPYGDGKLRLHQLWLDS